ncbi:uncharacterized protein BJX67DRAFT_356712 [Aspergillus lucknowensis]|uniref:RING-type domain-containing protein n=1 Tax=Aspergillus lucknowensis TaxID=176173 RepID=A0ABR4LNS1_9EURO
MPGGQPPTAGDSPGGYGSENAATREKETSISHDKRAQHAMPWRTYLCLPCGSPIEVVLGCGHGFCSKCCADHVHDTISKSLPSAESQRWESHSFSIPCPRCLEPLPGFYKGQVLAAKGFYFFTGCLSTCQLDCPANGYMLQGVRMKK